MLVGHKEYTIGILTESGCLLKLINGPSGLGFEAGGDQLA
jgi:hypothetical protein